MRPSVYYLGILLFIVLWGSCRKDFQYAPSSGKLEFSKDTVFLDTVFTNIGSSTYALKVYNRNRGDLEIPSIRLANGTESPYRLNVDGVAGSEFTNVPIYAQDSLNIFIETTFDISSETEKEFLLTDVIQFDAGIYQQDVHLVTLVKDAVFFYPKTLPNGDKETVQLGVRPDGEEIRSPGFFLKDNDLHFTNERPYVIYGFAVVDSGNTLIIDAGARVYFHKDSGIFVRENATVNINGELSEDQELLENEVIFEGDRLEPAFSDIPGQWGLVWLSAGSVDNQIEHLTIKNAAIGIYVEGDGLLQTPTLTIQNSQIHNSGNKNLWAKSAFIKAENLVLGSAGKNSLHCNLGGDYSFLHCTIANYWSQGFRTGSALQIDNFSDSSSSTNAFNLIKADFLNCIIDGNGLQELSLVSDDRATFNFFFDSCLIKFEDSSGQSNDNPLYNFENPVHYNQIFLNQNADFKDVIHHDFSIGMASTGNGTANLENAILVPFDILGVDRTVSPDIGAYVVKIED